MSSNNKSSVKIALIGVIVIILIPMGILLFSLLTDWFFRFPRLILLPFNLLVGVSLLSFGYCWAIWANFTLVIKGKGSAIPAAPNQTQKQVTSGPFKYSRNPMYFGYFLIILGLGVVFNSISILFIHFPILLVALNLFLKYVEEKALEKRFGEEFKIYKEGTSFIFPWKSKKTM